MTAPVAVVPKRLAVLFLLALLGIVVMIGSVIARAAGPVATVGYAVVVLAGLVLAARTARARLRAQRRAQGRTCDCCTTSVHDPIQVI